MDAELDGIIRLFGRIAAGIVSAVDERNGLRIAIFVGEVSQIDAAGRPCLFFQFKAGILPGRNRIRTHGIKIKCPGRLRLPGPVRDLRIGEKFDIQIFIVGNFDGIFQPEHDVLSHRNALRAINELARIESAHGRIGSVRMIDARSGRAAERDDTVGTVVKIQGHIVRIESDLSGGGLRTRVHRDARDVDLQTVDRLIDRPPQHGNSDARDRLQAVQLENPRAPEIGTETYLFRNHLSRAVRIRPERIDDAFAVRIARNLAGII